MVKVPTHTASPALHMTLVFALSKPLIWPLSCWFCVSPKVTTPAIWSLIAAGMASTARWVKAAPWLVADRLLLAQTPKDKREGEGEFGSSIYGDEKEQEEEERGKGHLPIASHQNPGVRALGVGFPEEPLHLSYAGWICTSTDEVG